MAKNLHLLVVNNFYSLRYLLNIFQFYVILIISTLNKWNTKVIVK
jgi:hypothetical protein